MNSDVRKILCSLSVTGNYRGYFYTIVACELILQDETRLHHITTEVYAEVARICRCELHSVERNIRTVIFHIWKNQKEQFCEIAGYPLASPPTVSEFLSILTNYTIMANA